MSAISIDEIIQDKTESMKEIEACNIEPRNVVCSKEQLEKLSTPEGCYFEVLDSSISDDDFNDDEELKEQTKYQSLDTRSEEEKQDYLAREYFKVKTYCTLDDHDRENNIDIHLRIHRNFQKSRHSFVGLIESGEYEDIADGLVYKKIIPHALGCGPMIDENSVFIYHIACWTEGKLDPYDSTWLRKDPILIDFKHEESILPGVRKFLLQMRKGEIREGLIKPEAAFGSLGVPPRIPADSIIYCVIEIVNILGNDRISKLAFNAGLAQKNGDVQFEEFYNASDEARKRGNYYLTDKQYKVAMARYKSGIRILESISYRNELEESKARKLLVSLYVNIAKAATLNGQPRIALSFCRQASELDHLHPKVYWQRMLAWKKKGHNDIALRVCRQAIQLFRREGQEEARKCFMREEENLKRLISEELEKQKRLYKLLGKAAVGDRA